MRLCGIRTADGVRHVAEETAEGPRPIAPVEAFWADPEARLAAWRAGERTAPVAGPVLVPPVRDAARVLCVGLNYRAHVAEGSYRDDPYPELPTVFGRWTASLSVDGEPAPVPAGEDGLDWEGEVVAYLGRRLVDATPEEARAAVIGYSTFNDLTARRALKATSQWTVGQNADASGPLGPLVTADEVGDLRDGLELVTRVNGEVVQRGDTRDLVHEVGEVLSLLSRTMTLHPGDLLATGTPAGVGYSRTPPWLLRPGDVVTVEVDRLGVLRTPIVENNARHG